jgi:hypothetical protein
MSPALAPAATGGKRGGPWLAHVKKTMKAEAGKKKSMGKKWFGYVLKSAKKSYHKKKHGGVDSDSDQAKGGDGSGDEMKSAAPVVDPPASGVGGRRRRGSKTRRHRRS